MNEADARNVLLVRAVEREDAAELLLTAEDRQRADAAGQAALAEAGPAHDGGATFLAARARFAAARLAIRHPAVARVKRLAEWPGWVGWGVPLAALITGLVANELGNGRRLDLLAVPLLGTLAWNLAVYLGLVVAPLAKAARRRGGQRPSLSERVAGWRLRTTDAATPMARAMASFAAAWARASAALNGARLARTLHLGAALFGAGLIAGIYLRALAIEYRAGWESTFLKAEQVRAILTLLLGPASGATGVPLPNLAGFEALRWRTDGTGGGNAGMWIHLYTATLAAVVVVPRLVLAAWQMVRVWRLRSRVPVPGREDFYVRRVLRSASGGGGVVRVTPYATTPDGSQLTRMETLIRAALGDGVQVRVDPPVPYGEEESWIAAAALDPATDHHLVLYALASTPEAENHGTFARLLAAKLGPATALSALVDESTMRSQLGSQGDIGKRIEARRRAWVDMLGAAALVPTFLDPSSEHGAAVRQLEGALITDPMLGVAP